MRNFSVQAIETKYHGPTERRGSRISARCESGRISIPYPHELDAADGHRKAAEALRDKLGWDHLGEMIQGGTRNGYVFVFAPGASNG